MRKAQHQCMLLICFLMKSAVVPCYHIVKLFLGIDVANDKQTKQVLTQLRKNIRKKQETKAGRKRPQPRDIDNDKPSLEGEGKIHTALCEKLALLSYIMTYYLYKINFCHYAEATAKKFFKSCFLILFQCITAKNLRTWLFKEIMNRFAFIV